jgi:mono/diheme cytochrome c family protein/plastocyanin
MISERAARLVALAAVVGLPAAVFIARWTTGSALADRAIEVHGRMPEVGGWTPSNLKATVGEPLHLRLTSDDVMHGFAVGKLDQRSVDVEPGKVTEMTITFSRPGKYVFYCTRWCGPNHWRMRGTIEVTGPGDPEEPRTPLYLTLGLELDAPHLADVLPARAPSAGRGADYGVELPKEYLGLDYYRRHSPAETWHSLRSSPATEGLSDMQVWDLVALVWRRNSTPAAIETGRNLFRANCSACHGERGGGDGVMASALAADSLAEFGRSTTTPADFTDPERMLGASPALLQGKIIRGGMGTGMPYWGPVLTDEQTWAVVDYLWTFQFPAGDRSDRSDR